VRRPAKTDNFLSKVHWEALYPNGALDLLAEGARRDGRALPDGYNSGASDDKLAGNPKASRPDF